MFIKRAALMAIFSLSIACSAWADGEACTCLTMAEEMTPNGFELDTPTYSRIVVTSQDYPWPGPIIPLDPNHQSMLNLNSPNAPIYTQADADALTDGAIDDFLVKYGVDFSLANPNVVLDPNTGVRTISGFAIFLPMILGENKQDFVIVDTKYPNRASTHRWYDIKVGQFILFTGSGTFAAGTNAGAQYQVGDLFSYGDINLVENGADWTNPQKRELIRFRTSNIIKQTANQWNIRQFAPIAEDIFDADGNQGLYMGGTAVLKEPVVTGTNILQERPVMTWK